ncbi:MAG: hypothetical protein GC159_06730 [Phycisphaera sp.]|nr:hypothetical protein [Phycisphaera sp.]
MKRKFFQFVRVLAAVCMLLGGIGYFGSLSINNGSTDWLGDNVELPLGDLTDVEVDGDGHVYCALQGYHRVQVYDADGRFVRGWQVESQTGRFRMQLGDTGHVEVATLRGDMLFVYDTNGKLLDARDGGHTAYFAFGEGHDRVAPQQGRDGHVYRVADAQLYPHVVRCDATDGGGAKESTVVSMPFYYWPFMAPVPALPMWMGGIFTLILTDKRYGDSSSVATAVTAD